MSRARCGGGGGGGGGGQRTGAGQEKAARTQPMQVAVQSTVTAQPGSPSTHVATPHTCWTGLDPRQVITLSDDHVVRLWDLRTHKCVQTVGHAGECPDGRRGRWVGGEPKSMAPLDGRLVLSQLTFCPLARLLRLAPRLAAPRGLKAHSSGLRLGAAPPRVVSGTHVLAQAPALNPVYCHPPRLQRVPEMQTRM